jgi:hypothetical protein
VTNGHRPLDNMKGPGHLEYGVDRKDQPSTRDAPSTETYAPGPAADGVTPMKQTGAAGLFYGRYWARTSDPQLVELVLSQLS